MPRLFIWFTLILPALVLFPAFLPQACPAGLLLPAFTLADGPANMAEATPMVDEIRTVALGFAPNSVVVTPDSKYAYVNDYHTGNVHRIDLATATVDRSVNPGGSNPSIDISITPDGGYVYETDYSNNRLLKIDTSTHTLATTIGVVGGPYNVTVHPNGTNVYVGDFSSDALRVVGVASNTLEATINGISNPCGLEVIPNGGFLYVTNQDRARVSKINTATNTVVGTIDVGSNPRYLATGPNNMYVYVTNMGSNTVSKINVATDNVEQTIPTGTDPAGVDVSPDGKYIFVSNGNDNTVSMINTATHTMEQLFDVGTFPRVCAVSPDGQYVLTADFFGLSVTIIKLSTAPDGTAPGNGPSPDLIPPGGPAHMFGGGDDLNDPFPSGGPFMANGQGGTPQGVSMAMGNPGAGAQAVSGMVKRNEVIPGLMFQRTGPAGAVEECWLPLGETGTMPGGVEYETGLRWNYDVRIIDLDCNWPESVIQNLSQGNHRLTYWLQTAEGLRSNCRVQHLVCGQATDASAGKAPVKRNAGELLFKLQVSYFNEKTGFVERIKEGMCQVEVDGDTWGTFPIVDGQLTARIPFGQTSLIKFIAQEFKGYKRVRIEFVNGFMYAYDHDFRDATIEVYQCLDGESYAIEYYRDLVYICNQGADPDGPILGRMFGR